MQIRVFEGSPDVFNAMLYPEQSQSSQTFLRDQLTRFSDTLTDAGRQFVEGAKVTFDKIMNSTAVQTARAIMRQAGNYFNPNLIVAIDNLEGLQQATVGMQRWLMAQPDIRQLYHKQLIDGYADTYVDLYPSDVGSEHYDYRRVMDGSLTEGGEDDDWDWESVQYPDDLMEGDRELTISEKSDIISTWDILKLYAEAREEDPTNPLGGSIG